MHETRQWKHLFLEKLHCKQMVIQMLIQLSNVYCVSIRGGGGGVNKLLYRPVQLAHISSLSISACLKVYRAKVGKD